MCEFTVMRTITKRLVVAQSAAAKTHDFTTTQVVCVPSPIGDGEIAFYFHRAIVIDGNFC